MTIRLFLTTLLLCWYSELMYSQSQRIDSLKDEINKNGESYDLLWRLGLAVSEYDNCSAYEIMRRCFELALSTGDTAKILFSGRTLGVFLNRLERGDSAIKIFTTMLPLARTYRDEIFLRQITNGIGLTLLFRARYSEALEYFSESLRERKKTGTEEEISIVLHNIGIVFYKMKLYQKGLEYLEGSLRLKIKIKYAQDLGPLKINVGLCKIFLKRYQEGLSDIQAGMEVHDHRPGVEAKVSGLYALGVAFYEMEKFTQAEQFFKNSYRIARKNNLKRFRADNLVYLARLAAVRHDFAYAITLLNEAEDVIRLSDYDELSLTIYGDLIRLYAGDPEKLKECQNRYIGLRQRIYNTELAGRMQQFEEDLERDEHEARILQQQQLVQINTQIIQGRHMALVTTALALVLLSVVIWSGLRYNAQKRIFNNDLINTVKIRSLALDAVLKEAVGKSEIQRVKIRNLNQIVSTYRITLNSLSVGMIKQGGSNGMKVRKLISKLFEYFP